MQQVVEVLEIIAEVLAVGVFTVTLIGTIFFLYFLFAW